jgi:hypothetical protein
MPRVYLVMAIIGAGLLALGSTFLLAVPLVSDHASPSSLFLKGQVDLKLYDQSGRLKDERHFDNLIVNSGIQGVANLIAPAGGGSSSPFNYIALGTGTTPVNAGQTALVAEFPASSGYSRINVPVAAFSTSNNQLLLSATFGPGQATGPISESGVFNAANGGTMLARQTFSTINKGMSDSLTVSWAIALSSS